MPGRPDYESEISGVAGWIARPELELATRLAAPSRTGQPSVALVAGRGAGDRRRQRAPELHTHRVVVGRPGS